MTKQEREVYKLELKLIRKHFKGLRPRPVKVVKESKFDGQADEPNLLIDRRVLKDKVALENVLKHELIHYELKDGGKDYHGHGQAFLKRATELGIVGSFELERCFSIEESEGVPMRRTHVQVPLDTSGDEGRQLALHVPLAVSIDHQHLHVAVAGEVQHLF